MTKRNSEYFPYAAAGFSGLIVCLGIAIATGRREAWDSGAYLSLGIPMMCCSIFAISYVFPQKAWRWTLSMAVGQSVSMWMGGSSLSLWPLAIVAMTIYSIPQFIAGFAGSKLGRERRARA